VNIIRDTIAPDGQTAALQMETFRKEGTCVVDDVETRAVSQQRISESVIEWGGIDLCLITRAE
jgi:hypothetical protein